MPKDQDPSNTNANPEAFLGASLDTRRALAEIFEVTHPDFIRLDRRDTRVGAEYIERHEVATGTTWFIARQGGIITELSEMQPDAERFAGNETVYSFDQRGMRVGVVSSEAYGKVFAEDLALDEVTFDEGLPSHQIPDDETLARRTDMMLESLARQEASRALELEMSGRDFGIDEQAALLQRISAAEPC